MHDQDTIELPLSRGLVAIVDADDSDLVLPYKWTATRASRKNVYAFRNAWRPTGKKSPVMLHRVIMGVEDPSVQIDHKDGDGLNNRRSNLRIATNQQNHMNMRVRSSSGYKGVTWSKKERKWTVQINFEGKNRRIGAFDSPEDAARAYDRAAREMYGEFAWLNFSD